jgi:multiple sugar transport system permease protein
MAKRKTNIHGREGIAGWVFTAPAMIILGIFLFVPIVMALWVSMTNWTGNVDPFGGGPNATFIGADNYTALFLQDGLARSNFMQSLGNTFYYVLLVVPLQTATSLLLALIVNEKFLRGKSFFRTAFYFPSVTSSIAISTVFLFLFSNTGAVNGFLKLFGIDGPEWFSDSRGLLHMFFGLFGAGDNPAWGQGEIFGRSLWDWLSGPSVAMCVIIVLAVWTTTGTFMLMFLAALQDLPVEVDEAAMLDGVSPWQKLRLVTIYVMGKGAPAGTTMTPAFLSYKTSFTSNGWGSGAAIAFVIFLIIVILTGIQRRMMREDKPTGRLRGAASRARLAQSNKAAATADLAHTNSGTGPES